MRAVLAILLVSLALPAWAGPADPWTIDPAKSRIAFSVEQIGKIASGRIGGWTGSIVFDPQDLGAARIDVRMDLRTAATGAKDVDDMMLGRDFLDAARQAEARFTSTSVSGTVTITSNVLNNARRHGIQRCREEREA